VTRSRTASATPAASGLLVVDKPAGWTSHDVVARARRLCGTRRVGHAGTLDPMATGVLVLGVERGTKLLTFLVGCDKSYRATIRLGQDTVTDDAEGDVVTATGVTDRDDLLVALPGRVAALTGDIEQVPSSVSAIKVDGVRSYTRVRQGDAVELAARPVTVSRFDLLATRTVTTPDGLTVVDVDVEVDVSSGTYVRALARDLGAALGVGGHLTALRRTRVGRFGLDQAADFAALVAAQTAPADGDADPATATAPVTAPSPLPLIPLAEAARAQLPVHELTEAEAVRIGHGQRVPSAHHGAPGDPGDPAAPGALRASGMDAVAALDPAGRLVAVLDETGPTAKARVVFETAPPR
jgi:tRNA pseudouridine55 synthase